MEDRYSKYVRLSGGIFLIVVSFILSLILLMLGLRLIFGLLNQLSWFKYLYTVFILLVPAALFITGYLVYIKRTTHHPKKAIRVISYTVFAIALIFWFVFLFLDFRIFIEKGSPTIGKYHSFNWVFLAANVACFFLIGMLQALSMDKEPDWLEKHQSSGQVK